jgi:hypothetical protein
VQVKTTQSALSQVNSANQKVIPQDEVGSSFYLDNAEEIASLSFSIFFLILLMRMRERRADMPGWEWGRLGTAAYDLYDLPFRMRACSRGALEDVSMHNAQGGDARGRM